MTTLTSVTESLQKFCGDGVTYRSYSGRGMYGRSCVAITGDFSACMEVIGETIKDLHSEVYDAALDSNDDGDDSPYKLDDEFTRTVDDLMRFSYDSMGLDVVVYWPDLEFEEREEDDDADGELPKEP